MHLHLLGVRGSTPTPGIEFVRYGGNTSCVAVGRDGEPASLVLDAGTGIRGLSELLDGRPFEGSILLSHLHWDHVEGLPFCRAIDRPDARVDLYLPAQPDGTGAAAALAKMMSPPSFPIGPEGLLGTWTFTSLPEGERDVEAFELRSTEVAHSAGTTYGYRVSDGRSVVAYLPDHCPTRYGSGPEGLGDVPPAVLDLVEGADVLIHDALVTREEMPAGAAFGHAAADYAISLGMRAHVGTVVLFHHSPLRTDDLLDALGDRLGAGEGPHVVLAREGTTLTC